MIGVKTARAMVIDDDPKEAMPVLMALGRMGIGAIYLKGDKVEELPSEPLDGIRLLFLDMVLAGTEDSVQVVSHLMGVLKRVLPNEPHPILIVLWTNRFAEYGGAFTKALLEEFKQLPKGIVVAMEKSQFALEAPETITKIADTITGHIEKRPPMNLLWHWEQSVHDAATRTTSVLMQLVMARLPNPDADFLPILWKVLKTMVVAAGGEAEHSWKEAVALLYETLNSLHFDRVETALASTPEALAKSTSELTEIRKVTTSPEEKAQLNRMILTSKPLDHIPRPGSVYLRKNWPVPKTGGTPFDMMPGTTKELTKDIFDAYLDPAVLQFQAEQKVVSSERAASGARADAEIAVQKTWEKLQGAYAEALVEFTPICDFAQGKQSMLRLVRAFFVAKDLQHLIKQAPYLHKIGPLDVSELGGSQYLVLNARYLIGYPVKDCPAMPLFRLRQQVMVALQAWFASHAARPGYLFIDR